MDLSVIDKINQSATVYPEVAEVKKILSENGVDFERKTIDIEKFIEYHKRTSPEGIIMPTKESLLAKVFVCLILFPQKENGQINYLFGKGIGVEIALLGQCQSRTTNDVQFETRSHSDFEIYDVKDAEIFDRYPEFIQVYGSQEYFTEQETKAFRNLPKGSLDETHEVIDFYGIEVLVPSLEVLFVDKYIKYESTPRPEGIDAELLAKKYKLNPELCKQLYVEYYARRTIEERLKLVPSFEEMVRLTNDLVKSSMEDKEEGPYLIKNFNKFVKKFGNRDYKSSSGILYAAALEIEDSDIVDGKLTEEYVQNLRKKYDSHIESISSGFKTQCKEMIEAVTKDHYDTSDRETV